MVSVRVNVDFAWDDCEWLLLRCLDLSWGLRVAFVTD